jgi:CRP-like cAMP-binding protein
VRNLVGNRLLRTWPGDALKRLERHFEPVSLAKGDMLFLEGERARYVYFPTSGMVSLMATSGDGESIELASMGSDGVIGIDSLLSVLPQPFTAVVQIAGDAHRIQSVVLAQELRHPNPIQQSLLAYTVARTQQIAVTAVCQRFHPIEQRLCRTLLLARRYACSDVVELTQEVLARMLGVQRSAVSAAATLLQDANVIRLRHGRIRMLDRAAMEEGACDCYRLLVNRS